MYFCAYLWYYNSIGKVMTDLEKRNIVKSDYDEIASIYAEHYSKIAEYITYIDDFKNNLDGNIVLEIGCGAGKITNYLTEHGYDVTGIDFSENILKLARKKFPNSKFVCADICEYETDRKYDGVFTKDMLFHLPDADIRKVLHKVKNWLKIGGKFCIIMDISKNEGEHIFTEELNENYKIYYNYMSPKKVEGLLKENGFVVNEFNVVGDNKNASSYASGFMVFQCENKME